MAAFNKKPESKKYDKIKKEKAHFEEAEQTSDPAITLGV